MATHSSVLAWRIPGTEEPGGLLSMGSHRVGHDWSDLAAAAAAGKQTTLCLWCYLHFLGALIPVHTATRSAGIKGYHWKQGNGWRFRNLQTSLFHLICHLYLKYLIDYRGQWGEEGGRGWDVWIASLIQWTWTWANSGRWWGIGRPGMLQSTGLQVGQDLATE